MSRPDAPDRLVIGVCTYNRGPALLHTLSAVADTVPHAHGRVVRIIVVDNNSTDGTPDRIRAFAGAASVRVDLVHAHEQGLSHARRRLLEASDEPLLAFVDDDCLPDPGWAAAVLARFDSSPRAGAVGGIVALEWETGPTPLARRCAVELAQQDHGPGAKTLADGQYLVGAAMALRRTALAAAEWPARALLIDRAGASLSSGGDTEIGARLRRAGWELWYDPAARARHLIPAARQSRAYLARLLYATAHAEPTIRWLASDEPPRGWVAAHEQKARERLRRTRLLEWRPNRRFLRINQRRGRVAGWQHLLSSLPQTR